MKITNNTHKAHLNNLTAAKQSKTQQNNKKITNNNSYKANNDSAKINLSNTAKDINNIKKLATPSQDIDLAKVEKIKNLINQGKYKINAEKIADKMVDEHLLMS